MDKYVKKLYESNKAEYNEFKTKLWDFCEQFANNDFDVRVLQEISKEVFSEFT